MKIGLKTILEFYEGLNILFGVDKPNNIALLSGIYEDRVNNYFIKGVDKEDFYNYWREIDIDPSDRKIDLDEFVKFLKDNQTQHEKKLSEYLKERISEDKRQEVFTLEVNNTEQYEEDDDDDDDDDEEEEEASRR